MSFFQDYKYFELIRPLRSRRSGRGTPVILRSGYLNEVNNAWSENIFRTNSFSLFPAEVAATALQKQLWMDYAIFKVTGKLTPKESPRFGKKTQIAIAKEIEKQRKAWEKKFFSTGMNAADKRRQTVGVDYINQLLRREIGAMQSMESIFFSVVIESWMAFETLVADLFYQALDHGPGEWRINVQSKHKEFQGGSDWEPKKVLPATPSDPQESYGSSLKDINAISFQKFRLIKFLYWTAFGKEVERLFFETDSGYIRALAAVRNVITHNAGIADETFVNEVKKYPELCRGGANKPILLDGEIVRRLRRVALTLGNALINHLDDALVRFRAKS